LIETCKPHAVIDGPQKTNEPKKIKIKHLKTTHLSNVAARMYLPLGENLTNDTGGLSSSEIRKEGKETRERVRESQWCSGSTSVSNVRGS
jgi:hypothetical protein